MGEVVDFARAKANRPARTLKELAQDSLDFLAGEWELMAKKNRLNDYFKSSLPSLIDLSNKSNFMADLSAISALECKLNFMNIVYGPGMLHENQLGWIAAFKLGEETFQTVEIGTEAGARAFCLLFFLSLKRAALKEGLLD